MKKTKQFQFKSGSCSLLSGLGASSAHFPAVEGLPYCCYLPCIRGQSFSSVGVLLLGVGRGMTWSAAMMPGGTIASPASMKNATSTWCTWCAGCLVSGLQTRKAPIFVEQGAWFPVKGFGRRVWESWEVSGGKVAWLHIESYGVSGFGFRGGPWRHPFGGHDSLPPRVLQLQLDIIKGLWVVESRARAQVLEGLGSMARV